ncbi:hypothetical protein AMATHDRAFT_144718 [Amanita thiersii Skay4041]|uniref:RRM domain-containing protein n=1 Tax=Amanita thiersii Skay4041 TaxID=703135 RepID=A0A2A9NQM5_9AGAR|nr:hypothetical protein AMATHDRAFT_144718 [Amanita thiersii Skay4041]
MDPHYDSNIYQPPPSHPHPYLTDPLVYITNIPHYVTDENIATALVSCAPLRPKIVRDPSSTVFSGVIEFKFLEKAEKALATLQSRFVPNLTPPVPLVLSPFPPTIPPTPIPPPSAIPRLVKHLPSGYTDSQLYDLFRPYGALASARTPTHFGPDTGMIEFWHEEDARHAEEAMHCAEVDGQNIAVQAYQPRRSASGSFPEFSPAAPAFVPAASVYSPYPSQVSPLPPVGIVYSPPRTAPYPIGSPRMHQFIHGPGQQVQLAPLSGPGSNSHSGLIDPCNLFCKNLDPEIDSNGLFTHFRQFGQIVSARVMRNENGESRGFGFVSYQTPEQAATAMHSMNGVQLGSKQIVVRLHEPKQLRQEKLAQRFGHNGHPRTSSGATSPTASEAGESYIGWSSPRVHPASLAAQHHDRHERGRRGSGSYYNAALSGTLNLPMCYDDLAALSPVVRKEVLTGELSRRIKTMDVVPTDDVDEVVRSLVSVSLSEVIKYIEDPNKLKEQALGIERNIKAKAPSPAKSPEKSPEKSPSPAVSSDSRSPDSNLHNATASAPEHPSTPVSISASLTTPPRTSSPSGSVPPVSERDRMLAAVSKIESSRLTELTDLLMSLPKRERAMCLFNVEVLRAKLVDAKMVLDSEDDQEEAPKTALPKPAPQLPAPATPVSKKVVSQETPQTPELSSRGPSATSSPLPATPSTAGTNHTIASLAKLSAAEIVRLANLPSSSGLPLPKPDPSVVQSTDAFIDGLLDKQINDRKQELGKKLFKVVKSFGIKTAPKITVALLDQEDLRALAHLMNCYPAVLKEKVLAMAAK